VNLRLRRAFVVAGVVASLIVGLISIRIAAELTASAAPPSAPPVSIEELRSALAAEQARAGALQQQLEELLGVTGQLSTALEMTGEQVSVDGLTADQLRDRLKAAEAKLATVTELLKQAEARLAQLQAAAAEQAAADVGTSGAGAGPAATPKPTPQILELLLTLDAGGVGASWTSCITAALDSYVLVRSIDHEVHYPPEDGDSIVARVSSTGVLDGTVPPGTSWYRVYCLALVGGQVKTVAKSGTESIVVP